MKSTDEQAPIPTVFDLLINQVAKTTANVDILFNCQMGYVSFTRQWYLMADVGEQRREW